MASAHMTRTKPPQPYLFFQQGSWQNPKMNSISNAIVTWIKAIHTMGAPFSIVKREKENQAQIKFRRTCLFIVLKCTEQNNNNKMASATTIKSAKNGLHGNGEAKNVNYLYYKYVT